MMKRKWTFPMKVGIILIFLLEQAWSLCRKHWERSLLFPLPCADSFKNATVLRVWFFIVF